LTFNSYSCEIQRGHCAAVVIVECAETSQARVKCGKGAFSWTINSFHEVRDVSIVVKGFYSLPQWQKTAAKTYSIYKEIDCKIRLKMSIIK